MNAQELKSAYNDLYGYMASSKNPANMKAFGKVMTEMYNWFSDNKPDAATEWLDKLSAIKWKNYLTPKEADAIVSQMNPKAPWSREQWKAAMDQNGFPLEKEPYYNRCAIYTTMNMIMSDSSTTLTKYVDSSNLFKVVYDLAVDKLTDTDGKFMIRHYFNLLPMGGYRELMRRKLLYNVYDRLSEEEKRTFVQLTMQDKDHEEIMDALKELRRKADGNHHSFTSDLLANISGNAIFEGAVWLFSRLMRRL